MTKPLCLSKILWDDAEDFEGTWASKEEAEKFSKEVCLVTSIGFIVKKTPRYVTIAGDVIGEETFGRLTKIPTKMIKKIETL